MDAQLELAIKNRQWSIVASYATKSGEYKNQPVSQIEIRLKAQYEMFKKMGLGKADIILKIQHLLI